MNAKTQEIKVIEQETLYDGYFRIDRYVLRHSLFQGGWSGPMEREVFERGHAAAVILFDPDLDRMVFIEQFRPGAYAALASPWFADDASPWLIECVAGIIEEGESPMDVVRREAMEEAGLEVAEMEPICHYLASPGASSESIFLFVGRVDASLAGGIHGIEEEHENIRVHVVSTEEAFRWLDEGRILNAMTLIPMHWFRHRHQDLRRRWRAKPAG